MKTFTTLALGACMTVALAGAGFAQSSSMSNMTAAEKTTMTKCKGMSPSAMQQNADCSALMKKYPDAATSGMASPSDKNATPPKNQGK
jgi:hypothetical protein